MTLPGNLRSAPTARAYVFPTEDYRRIAREFDRLLRRVGDAPLVAMIWSEHLLDQSAQGSHRQSRQDRLAGARAFVQQYNRFRFGNPNDPAALAELRRLFNAFKETQ